MSIQKMYQEKTLSVFTQLWLDGFDLYSFPLNVFSFTRQAEVQMEVESLNSAKQKISRKLIELKEEASREASLRSSLEESHATLLTRLHDLEAVIENLQSEVSHTPCYCTLCYQQFLFTKNII